MCRNPTKSQSGGCTMVTILLSCRRKRYIAAEVYAITRHREPRTRWYSQRTIYTQVTVIIVREWWAFTAGTPRITNAIAGSGRAPFYHFINWPSSSSSSSARRSFNIPPEWCLTVSRGIHTLECVRGCMCVCGCVGVCVL